MATAKVNGIGGHENKEIRSLTLTPEIITSLQMTSGRHNLSVSEIVEFAVRKLYNLPTENCKQKLNQVFA